MDLVTLSAGAATFLSIWQLVPQVRRVRAVGSIEGLSVTWAVVGFALNLGWVGYRVSQEMWLALASPVVALGLYLALFVMILGSRNQHIFAGVVSLAAFALAIGSAMMGGWVAVGLLLGAGSLVHLSPSVWAAYRSPSPVALSVGAWAIALSQALLWTAYGWGSGDSIHLIYGLATAPGAAAILGRCLYTRHMARRAAAGVAVAPSMASG